MLWTNSNFTAESRVARGDKVLFELPTGLELKYTVYSCYCGRDPDEYAIFHFLGLNAWDFCSKCIGYLPSTDRSNTDIWPAIEAYDYDGLSKIIFELYQLVGGTNTRKLELNSIDIDEI